MKKKIILPLIILLLVGGGTYFYLQTKKDGNNNKPTAASLTSTTGKDIIVYKDPNCGCCSAWADYMQKNGYNVTLKNTDDIGAVKEKNGVPENLSSCHTAFIDGYVIEGHVPVEMVNKLLAERPNAKGIAVPGMPSGSPGMEGPGKPYEVILFDAKGHESLFGMGQNHPATE